ncbi:VOC family protein [Winogradskya humida]|uniref:Glyoxalase-like domain-containing protein n=1 Tax=Winogradskya humida TaxID=113566 RepID=A0ABQ4A7L2_9ACTN|nr:VOC family protein [Actinoplanes humidus]GIE26838.1 hypothetical protein Ahu01nite_099400 [Actinoplanes humidus]
MFPSVAHAVYACMLSDVVVRATQPTALFNGLELDVIDHKRQAEFWRTALGGVVKSDGDQSWRIHPGPGRPAREILRLQPVAALPSDDARVHVDVRLPGAGPDHFLDRGARLVRRPGDDPWYVLADPEFPWGYLVFDPVPGSPAGPTACAGTSTYAIAIRRHSSRSAPP